MSLGDFAIKDLGGLSCAPTTRYRVAAGSTTINAGEPVKVTTADGAYVVRSADAEPLTSTPTFAGIAASTSTQTAGADGVVDVYGPTTNMVFRGNAKVATAVDTDAELIGLLNNRVVFDLTGAVFTVDESFAVNAVNGLVIVGGDILTGKVDFVVRNSVLYRN